LKRLAPSLYFALLRLLQRRDLIAGRIAPRANASSY
jgi:hypothetical protein